MTTVTETYTYVYAPYTITAALETYTDYAQVELVIKTITVPVSVSNLLPALLNSLMTELFSRHPRSRYPYRYTLTMSLPPSTSLGQSFARLSLCILLHKRRG